VDHPQVSAEMGLPYREGLVKNRYVGRTFIMPDQRMREMSVRRKLNAMPAVFEGRNVLLIDDSIVRGTTMAQIVDMVRKAGARKVSKRESVVWVIHTVCKVDFVLCDGVMHMLMHMVRKAGR
jgi:glutamine phosphoribosylpyrophosphate amidotransferase